MGSVKLKLKVSQKLKDGSHPIIIQVLKDNKKAISTLGVSCFFKDWNTKTNLPKNRRLSVICQRKLLEMEELLFEGIDNGWDSKKIVNIFSGKDTKKLMFFDYCNKIRFERKKSIATLTLDQSKLRKFKTFLSKDDLPFDQLTFKLLSDYKKYLEGNGVTSIIHYLSIISQIYDHAVENDAFLPKKNPFKSSLYPKQIKSGTLNRNLDKDQVIEFFDMSCEKSLRGSYKEQALDFWKFCFLMRGINIIELAVMRPENIQGDYYEFTREKLKTRVSNRQRIRIYPEAREIIDKYLDTENEYIFPLLDNGFDRDNNKRHYQIYKQRLSSINYNLINWGDQLGLDFNMTSMSARYSFVNLAKQNEVPFLYLQELMGHKTKSTTDIYLDVFPQSKIDQYHREVIDLILHPHQAQSA